MPDRDKFHWAKRVSRRDIQRLYEGDAQGLRDEELLEKIHYALHARVCDMFELREARKSGKAKCRGCGEPLPHQFRMGERNKGKLLECGQCGWKVSCGEFFESYAGKSMLPGSATGIFEEYLERHQKAKTSQEKMLLIDWLIHQFHVMQDVPRMPVGSNLIEGSADQVRELIESLAGGSPGLSSREEWRSIYYHPVRIFKQAHSHAEVKKIAVQLGIMGRKGLSEDELIPEILRRAPELAASPRE